MKSASLVRTGLAVFLVVACAPEPKMPELDPVAVMAAAYTAAWCSQDPAQVAAHYAENGSLKINDGSPAVGRTAITASAQAFMASLPDMVVAMDSLRVNDRSGRYYWTLTGTNTGPGGTGKAIRISGYEEWTLGTGGLIERSLGHFDAVEYARQIREGVSRAP